MPRPKKRETDESTKKARHFRFLLYVDNPEHVAIFEYLEKLDKGLKIWIEHKPETEMNVDTGDVVETGKAHIHYYISFENPVNWYRFAELAGNPDRQFCRIIDGRFDNALLYLCHTNTPEKEQYALSALHGSPELIKRTERVIQRYHERDIPLSEAVLACVLYISDQSRADTIISTKDLIFWAVSNGVFKGVSNVSTRDVLREHNEQVRAARMDKLSKVDWLDADFREVTDDEWQRMMIDYEADRKRIVAGLYHKSEGPARKRVSRVTEPDSLS